MTLRNERFFSIIVFLSGASSLIFEAVFTRLLRYVFGSTAQAVSTVLACFLAGLSLGAWAVGAWIKNRPATLRTYGLLELLVAIYGALVPVLFPFSLRAYVAVCHWFTLAPAGIMIARFGVAAVLVLLPSFAVGGTLPVLAHYLSALRSDFQPELDRLYSWNTFGAAFGILFCTYVLMPKL